ncbi:MAG: chemotaxis protein CheW [Lachnospiraceae bacterium]
MEELAVKNEFQTTQYIVIQLGDEKYGIDIQYVDNIVRMQRITRVPKVAKYFKGVINLRGEVVPVMNIRIKMDLDEAQETKDTRIIILKLDGMDKIGVIVDEVREVVELNDSEVEKVAYDSREEKQQFVSAVGKVGEDLISLLDLHTVIAE